MFDTKTQPTAKVPFQSGSFPVRSGYAPEWGIVNYTMFRIAPSAFLTLRNEFYDDIVEAEPGTLRSTQSIHSVFPGGRTKS
jgi:hypothetical protein